MCSLAVTMESVACVRLTVRTQGSRGVRAAWKATVLLVSQAFTRGGTSAYDVPAGAEALGALLRASHCTVCSLAVTMESVACVRLTVRTQGSRGVRAAWKPTVFLVSQGFTQDRTSAYDVPAGVEALSALLTP